MEAIFYKHDSYLTIRQKFTAAWPNLRLELHRQSVRFRIEGDDECELDTQFFPTDAPDGLLFTLTGRTTKAAARRLFFDHYSYHGQPEDCLEASIGGNFHDRVSYPLETDTLDECNNPFVLELNRFNYAEFKRRFSARWTNLSIKIFYGEIAGDNAAEIADDFEMKNLTRINRLLTLDYYERSGKRDVIEKRADEAILQDGIYLSAPAQSLEKVNVFFRIKNEKLGIYWERNSKYHRLKEFQEAELLKSEKSS